MSMTEIPKALKGEGETKTVTSVKVRKRCEVCNGLAKYRHTLLLEGMRSNPASQAYGMDDCSYCVDDEIFTCGLCKPDVPAGYTEGSRYECTERFAHMFLQWEEVEEDIIAKRRRIDRVDGELVESEETV